MKTGLLCYWTIKLRKNGIVNSWKAILHNTISPVITDWRGGHCNIRTSVYFTRNPQIKNLKVNEAIIKYNQILQQNLNYVCYFYGCHSELAIALNLEEGIMSFPAQY